MRNKLYDALLGKSFRPSEFKPLLKLAVSRLAVFKKQRQVLCDQARSDVLELLNLGHNDRALTRVEHVIKEQNMLDAFVLMEDYCTILIDRVELLEHERECPEELKEQVSSLMFAAPRCGAFPELSKLRSAVKSRFGKEFVARAEELRSNCGVNLNIIQKLSTKKPSLESKIKVLKEIASENGIALELDEGAYPIPEEKPGKQIPSKSDAKWEEGSETLGQIARTDEGFSTMTTTKKYKDAADAAEDAFRSAAYAAAAARAAAELSRSGPLKADDDDHSGSNRQNG